MAKIRLNKEFLRHLYKTCMSLESHNFKQLYSLAQFNINITFNRKCTDQINA